MLADHEPTLANLEPLVAPEPVLAHDPLPVHDPIPVDASVVAPPVVDIPVVAPPVVDAPVIAPPVVDIPVVVAPLPDPAPVFVDRAPFATHVDPRYADTRNGWIEDDDYPPFVIPVTPPAAPVFAPLDVPQFHPHVFDVHRMDLPITFLQDIPPPRPGEGPSTQQHDHMPPMSAALPFMPPFACDNR
ncbi:proline-rich extensin-like protein EPR1 [Helianthus annuus]|uniref:proline-rich extensin-like protein EPR1 n=1 Tax=Helianthus annuus TaxID=4232 RepID=UPI000B8EFE7D|nr:proline-rich extensin-like protein EPR1 [Helianthus annuus]